MKTKIIETTVGEITKGITAIGEDNIRRLYNGNDFGKNISDENDVFNGSPDDMGLFIQNGNVCVRAPYQRTFVWDEEQQRKLIESLHTDFQ